MMEKIKNAKHIVVKVGTSTLTYPDGRQNKKAMAALVRQMATLYHQGKKIIFVTSGAVGAGMGALSLSEKPHQISRKQALAAVGQSLLMQSYALLFDAYDIPVAQILLTKDDFSHRERYLNARNTLNEVLRYGAVPIINENDTVAVDEIKVGDNDTLAAMVAGMIGADLLVLLTDVDGLYTKNPKTDPDAQKISIVERLSDDIFAMGGSAGSKLGTGGMATKLTAAKIAGSQGIYTLLCSGQTEDILLKIASGEENGTLFLPKAHKKDGKKGWLTFLSQPEGIVTVDEGAEDALLNKGRSLLPSGIVSVSGIFDRGAVIQVMNRKQKELARGYSNYSSAILSSIIGKHSSEIKSLLGADAEVEAIHRDNLSLQI